MTTIQAVVTTPSPLWPQNFSLEAKWTADALNEILPLKTQGIIRWLTEGRRRGLINGKDLQLLLSGFVKEEVSEEFGDLASLLTDGMIRIGDGCPLQPWANTHQPRKELFFAQAFWDQLIFVRDTLSRIFYNTFEELERNPVLVVSTHISKSVTLPVYKICSPNVVTLYLRYNFYDWKVSVISTEPTPDVFLGLFDRTETIHSVYFEGFRPDWIFGSYRNDPSKFSVELHGDYQLYTFAYLLNEALQHRKQK